jgi:hypothetical protein
VDPTNLLASLLGACDDARTFLVAERRWKAVRVVAMTAGGTE